MCCFKEKNFPTVIHIQPIEGWISRTGPPVYFLPVQILPPVSTPRSYFLNTDLNYEQELHFFRIEISVVLVYFIYVRVIWQKDNSYSLTLLLSYSYVYIFYMFHMVSFILFQC